LPHGPVAGHARGHPEDRVHHPVWLRAGHLRRVHRRPGWPVRYRRHHHHSGAEVDKRPVLHLITPLLAVLGLMFGVYGAAWAQTSTDFDFVFDVDVTNATGGNLCNVAVRVPVNASTLIDNDYLRSDGTD